MNLRRALLLAVTIVFAFILIYVGCFLIPMESSLGPFDRRAIQHLFGFWGVALIVQGVIAGLYSREAYMVHAVLLGCVAVASWLELFFPTALPLSGQVRALAAPIRNPGSVYLIGFLPLLYFCRMKSRAWVAVIGLTVCLYFSLSWEMFQQPVVGVYDGPPRGTIQTYQIVADILGMVLALMTLWGLVLRSTEPARKAGQVG